MIIDAYATDTTPSHEVRRRALAALTNAGEPMSEVTYDALRKRLAESLAHIAELEKALRSIANNTCCDKCQEAALVARAALEGKKDD